MEHDYRLLYRSPGSMEEKSGCTGAEMNASGICRILLPGRLDRNQWSLFGIGEPDIEETLP